MKFRSVILSGESPAAFLSRVAELGGTNVERVRVANGYPLVRMVTKMPSSAVNAYSRRERKLPTSAVGTILGSSSKSLDYIRVMIRQ
jgi:hypothetical protein